jgi:hypothetical protein
MSSELELVTLDVSSVEEVVWWIHFVENDRSRSMMARFYKRKLSF